MFALRLYKKKIERQIVDQGLTKVYRKTFENNVSPSYEWVYDANVYTKRCRLKDE